MGEGAGPPAQRPNALWAKDLDAGQMLLKPSAEWNSLEKDVSPGEHTHKRPAPSLPWSSDSFHETISEMLSAFTPKLSLFDL